MSQLNIERFIEQAKLRRKAMIALSLQAVRQVAHPVTLGLDPPEGFRPHCHSCPSEELMEDTGRGWRCDNCGSQVDRNLAPLNG